MTAEYISLLKIMEERRSIRRFQSRPVPKRSVEMLVEAAGWAPSAGNHQNFRFLIVSKADTINAIAHVVNEEIHLIRESIREDFRDQAARYTSNFTVFSRAPLLMIPIHRQGPNLLNALCGKQVVAKGDDFRESYGSVSAAIMNLLLAAHSLGLGACWMTGPLIAEEKVSKILKVPSGWRISAVIPIGFPDESPQAPGRKSSEQLIRYFD